MRRTLLRSTLLSGGFATVASLVLVFSLGYAYGSLVAPGPEVSTPLLWGLAAWMVVNAVGASIAMFLNGAHVVREQVILAVLFALACLAGKVIGVQHLGLAGLPWITALTYSALTLIPYFVLLPVILRESCQPFVPWTTNRAAGAHERSV